VSLLSGRSKIFAGKYGSKYKFFKLLPSYFKAIFKKNAAKKPCPDDTATAPAAAGETKKRIKCGRIFRLNSWFRRQELGCILYFSASKVKNKGAYRDRRPV